MRLFVSSLFQNKGEGNEQKYYSQIKITSNHQVAIYFMRMLLFKAANWDPFHLKIGFILKWNLVVASGQAIAYF